jgi:periplasmic protein TonB
VNDYLPKWFDTKLAICAVASVLFHFALAHALQYLPPRHDPAMDRKIAIQVLEPPPPPPPAAEPPPEPLKPEPPPPVPPRIIPHEAPTPHPVKAPQLAPVAKDAPPPDHPAVTTDTTDEPVYGVSMSSTSPTGTGPAVPIGNTTRIAPNQGSAAPKPLAAPVAAFEATKMPLPQGRCFGKYTEEAKAAGDEGTVVLDLVVGEDGRVREVQVVNGLPHGLTEAAVAALKQCRFSPGEKDGKPVPVKVRGFKIHFVLSEAQ